MERPVANVRLPDTVEWKMFEAAVFLLQQRRKGVINSCIVRRMHPQWTPLWEKVVAGAFDELTDDDWNGIKTLMEQGLLEEARA